MNKELVNKIVDALTETNNYEIAKEFTDWVLKDADSKEITEYRNLLARLQGLVDMGSSNSITLILSKFKPRI